MVFIPKPYGFRTKTVQFWDENHTFLVRKPYKGEIIY